MKLTPKNVIGVMLQSKSRWDTVNKYITVVFTKKEADGRVGGEIEEKQQEKTIIELYIMWPGRKICGDGAPLFM